LATPLPLSRDVCGSLRGGVQLKEIDDAENNALERELRSRVSRLAIKKRSLMRPIRVREQLW
jgi:hypothetical protein